MKKLIPILFLVACSAKTNGAQLMVESQAVNAKCESTVLKGIDVTVCDVPGKDKILQFVGAYQKGKLPFQVYPLSDGTEPKKEGPAPTQTPPSPPPAPPVAGEGSGTGAGSASK